MTTFAVYDIGNQKVSDIELDGRIFEAKVSPTLIHDVIRKDLASQRKGTAATKNRALVRGGGPNPGDKKEPEGLAQDPEDLLSGEGGEPSLVPCQETIPTPFPRKSRGQLSARLSA